MEKEAPLAGACALALKKAGTASLTYIHFIINGCALENYQFDFLSLPTLDSKKLKNFISHKYKEIMQTDILDTLPWFHVRLHTATTKAEIETGLAELEITWYIGAYEVEANRNHWQLNIQSNLLLKDLRSRIKSIFKPESNQYSISSKRTTVKKLSTYLLKEGNYIYKGFDSKYIDDLKKITFKNSKKSKEQFYALDDEFLTDNDMTYQDYIRKFRELKLEHRQRGREETMLQQLDMLLQKKDPKHRKFRTNVAINNFENFYLGTN